MTQAPSPFSPHNPRLQTAWDASSLSALQFCPTFYKETIINGHRGDGVDLDFGRYFANAAETFKRARLGGKSKDDATLLAVTRALEDTWIGEGEHEHTNQVPNETGDGMLEPYVNGAGDQLSELHWGHPGSTRRGATEMEGEGGHPWGGDYEQQWRCTGTEPYKNAKGNKAKCPWSHKGKWFAEPGPSLCGECGSPTETQRRWLPYNPVKNRYSLIRLVAWYCFDQPDEMDQGLHPINLPNGTPAIELPWRMVTPWKNKYGEAYILAGYFDSIMSDGLETYITDNKTTKKTINRTFWESYSPNIQIDLYDVVGNILYPELKIKGVLLEGAQVLVNGARFGYHQFPKTEKLREETLRDIEWWINLAEQFAEADYYPMNKRNCWLCPLKTVCSMEPQRREAVLRDNFPVRKWNPLNDR